MAEALNLPPSSAPIKLLRETSAKKEMLESLQMWLRWAKEEGGRAERIRNSTMSVKGSLKSSSFALTFRLELTLRVDAHDELRAREVCPQLQEELRRLEEDGKKRMARLKSAVDIW